MFKILSFVLLITIVLTLIYGLNTNSKNQMSDTHDIKTGYTINDLYIIETKDSLNEFTGFAHSFYIYISEPYNSVVNLVTRDLFEITLNDHNIMTVKLGEGERIDYQLPLSKWINIVVNINPHALELYVDGSLLKSNINSIGHYSSDYYGKDIVVGGNGSVVSRNGWIAAYKYFDKPLDSIKINKMYQQNVNKYNTLRDEYGVLITLNKNENELARYTV